MIQLNWYQIFGQSIPDGRTVTPTDDIQIWLHCGNIWDKNYTTLAQVLADTDTLVALMASDNAVDYLVRSTSWIGNVAAIPVMTDNTHPSGICNASDSNPSYPAWHAFDGNGGEWATPTRTYPCWIGYKFDSPVTISKYTFGNTTSGGHRKIGDYTFEGSNTSFTADMVTLDYDTCPDGATTTKQTKSISSNTAYLYYRIYIVNGYHSGSNISTSDIQFYTAGITTSEIAMKSIGASDYASETLLADSTWNNAIQNSTYFEYVDNAKVPVMTSNTTPSGESFSGSALSVYLAYKAFDNDTSTEWISNHTSALSAHETDTIGYKFDNAVSIQKLYLHDYNPNYDFNVTYVFSGSNDGVTYTDLYTENTAKSVKNGFTQIINNSANYTYYRLTATMWASSSNTGNHPRFDILQFYGRQNGGVQTWLHTAGITNKTYTTLSEVFADSATLSTLMANHDAVDYLVTCKGWTTEVCSNQSAMSYIGLNNYCANKLLNDETWRTAICNSTYFESVLNVKVPVMTSATTPEGRVFANVGSYEPGKPPYLAFDNSTSTFYSSNQQSVKIAVGYEFPSAKRLYKARIMPYNQDSSNIKSINNIVQGSNDGVNYTNLGSATNRAGKAEYTDILLNDNTAYKYCRVFFDGTNFGTVTYMVVETEIQFYGREDV